MILIRIILCISLLAAAGIPRVSAQECVADSTDDYSFSRNKLITPVVLTTAGAIGISAFSDLKKSHGGASGVKVDEYLRFAPAAAYLALGSCGVKARSSFRDRLMAGATAYLFMGAAVYATKSLVHETRPDGSDRHSFPSGHVATTFTGAELMRIEYGNAIGAAGYAVAVGVGILRMYNNRHWYNDVLAGAGIGILCARAGYWLLPFERRLFGLDRRHDTSAAVVPFYSAPTRSVGLSFAMTIK